MRGAGDPWRTVWTGLAVFALASACRGLGFGAGALLAATPASGVALAAAVILRGPGALAAGLGFAAAGLLGGLGPGVALLDGAAHAAAAGSAAALMRGLARGRAARSRTGDWLIFLRGVGLFAAIVACAVFVAGSAGLPVAPVPPERAALLAAVFEPLGVLTVCAALFSLRETGLVAADLRPAATIAAVAALLVGLLALALEARIEQVDPAGLTLLLAVPLCLLIAMQRRSLDGAALSCLAAHAALFVLARDLGDVLAPQYVTAVAYLNLLVMTCQMVHAVNRDRLAALAEVEAQRRDLERRVAERTARLTAMTEKALAADAAKTRLLATVSHEVRTPLNGVLGMASVTLAGPLDPETRRNVEVIRTSGFHLLDVINRILDYSKLDHGRRDEPEPEDFDLAALAEEVLREARFLPTADGLRFELDATRLRAPLRRGNRHGLRQILTNLVGNAAKFTPKGSVSVTLTEGADDLVRIEVRDTGPGVPPSERARIFLPYEQGERGRHGGTGLGLAICAEVVRRMGGRIGVAGGPGEGATFWVEAPLVRAAAGAAPDLARADRRR